LTPKFGPPGYPYLLGITPIIYSRYPKEVKLVKVASIKVVGQGGFVKQDFFGFKVWAIFEAAASNLNIREPLIFKG